MANETTDAILTSLDAHLKQLVSQQAISGHESNRVAAEAAKKAVETAMAGQHQRVERMIEQKIATLAGTKAKGPTVIAALAVIFITLLSIDIGWILGHHDALSWLF